MKYAIRLADKNDLPAMLEIYDYYVRETAASFEYETPPLSEFTRRFETFTKYFPWFALERDGKIIGYSYAHRFHDRTAYSWCAELSIYLDNKCHGRGCGKALYTCLIETLRLQGFKTAIGIISHPNERSESFHSALGFTRQGFIQNTGYKHGAWYGTSWYTLVLGDYQVPPSEPLPLSAVKDSSDFKALLRRCAEMIK
jgi:phosphinothricin acetyltransferase